MLRLLESWLRRLMPGDDASALLGDLEEAAKSRGRIHAHFWKAGQLISAIGQLRKERRTVRHGHKPRASSIFLGIPFTADARYALRRWRHRPGFAIASIGTLAIGIGATTAIYSVVDRVLLAPPPWTEPDRLVSIHAMFPDRRSNPLAAATWNQGQFSYPAWDALRARPEFETVAVWRRGVGTDTTFGAERTELIEIMDVSSQFLPALGIPLAMGRTFNEIEDTRPTDSVLITHEAWQRRFGGRADIIGHVAETGNSSTGGRRKATVVGVIAPGFNFGGEVPPEMLLPVGIASEVGHQYPGASLRVIARLAPGTTIAMASGAADGIARAIERREPTQARVVPLLEEHWRGAAEPIWILFGGAVMLLLVACANVAGLLLGEGRVRRHEIGVRVALGGTRARIVRQLLVEHAMLAVAGAGAGLAIAYGVMQAFVAAAPAELPRVDTLAIDARVALFALAMSAATMLLFGVAPAVIVARTRTVSVLAEGSRDGAPGRLAGQRLVVGGAIALALVLLVGASLLGESLYRLTSRPLGFDPSGVAVVSFRLTDMPASVKVPPGQLNKLPTVAERQEWIDDMLRMRSAGWSLHMQGAMERLAAMPAVTGVAGAYAPPITGSRVAMTIHPVDLPATEAISIRQLSISPEFFDVMRIPLVRGRTFVAADRSVAVASRRPPPIPTPPRNVIISRELERRFFAGNGLGKRLMTTGTFLTPLDVVGVAEDIRWTGYQDDDAALIYVMSQAERSINTLLIRTSDDTTPTIAAARAALRDYDRKMVITSATSMDALVGRTIAAQRLRASLSAIFGGAALVLAAVGLYSLASRRVADRRREIGVRVALGARPRDVRRLVLRDALVTASLGFSLGIPLAIAGSRLTESLLFGVTASAPRIFLLAGAVLALATVVAALLPARRAAALDPLRALRE